MMQATTWGGTLALLMTTALGAQDTPIRATTEDGRWVLLHANGKWEFEARPAEEPLSGVRFQRPASSTTQREIFPNAAVIYCDPSKWTPEPSEDRTRFTFEHTNGDGYALVIRRGSRSRSDRSRRSRLPMPGTRPRTPKSPTRTPES